MTIKYGPEIYKDAVSIRPDFVQDTLSSRSDSTIFTDSISSINNDRQISLPADSNMVSDSAGRKTNTLILTDSISVKKKSSVIKPGLPLKQEGSTTTDLSDVCNRNPVADITYFNREYIINSIDPEGINYFPILFTEKTRQILSERKASAEKRLKTGESLPVKPFHDDWILGIILAAVILFAVVRTSKKSFMPGIERFFLFRGTKEEGSRDLMGIFQWQSTILNLSSFILIGLFIYFNVVYLKLIPPDISGFMVWLISLAIIIIAITIRHFICSATGILSRQEEAFRDYLHTIYQSYRFFALLLFFLIIIMSYTTILSEKSYFVTGVIFFSSLYLIRIFRLFIIFINRNISIFYLILYLCALEILPVLITLKYFSGLR
jgi:hypothetical protein